MLTNLFYSFELCENVRFKVICAATTKLLNSHYADRKKVKKHREI